MATPLGTLKNKRKTVKGQATRLETKLNTHDTTPLNQFALQAMLQKTREFATELKGIHQEICSTVADNDFETHETEFDTILAKLEDLDDKLSALVVPTGPRQTSGNSSNGQAQQSGHKFRLQQLELPNFNGDVLDWMSFQSSFKAAVHQDDTLSNCERLQYLKKALSGDAAKRIAAFQIEEDNVAPAWDILVKRYEDQETIIDATLRRFLLQPPIQSDSCESLRKFVDIIHECSRSLTALKMPVDKWDTILLFFLVEKLDADARRQWALTPKASRLATMDEFTDFIESRAKSLSSVSPLKPKPQGKQNDHRKPGQKVHHAAGAACGHCSNGNHPMYFCPLFKKATVQERWEIVKKLHLCFNCLLKNHGTQDCKQGKCKTCSKRHHSMLHTDAAPEAKTDPPHPLQALHASSFKTPSVQSQVLLATSLVKIPDAKGSFHVFRALVDPGSQVTLISEHCKQLVGLKSKRVSLPLIGLGTAGLGTASEMVMFNLQSCTDANYSLSVNALVLPRVTGPLPNTSMKPNTWKHIEGLELADPAFHTSSQIDMLLGADVCASIMQDGMRRGPSGTPTAWNSSLGWLLLGTVHHMTPLKAHFTDAQLSAALERFWDQEEIQSNVILTAEEKACEDHFNSTHKLEDGRYVLELPFKENPSVLGASRHTAIRRLLSLEKRLARNPVERANYNDFMQMCTDLGHMEEAPAPSGPHSYLPHHPVIKETSTTTKLRAVFSGKDPTSSGKSLNDILIVGPKLQPDLINTVIRFRTHIIAFTSDIVKMYRQVLIAPHHREFLRIVWRSSPKDPIQDHWMKTVTYGTASAPYQAVKALQQLALDFKQKFPNAAKVVLNSFYVDDLLSGAPTAEQAIRIYSELMKLLELGGFELRKWASNDATFLQAIPSEYKASANSNLIENDEFIKTLGLKWHPADDYFSFDVEEFPERTVITKRMILSDTLKTFDPCGSLAPVTVKSKMFLQKLWKTSCKWDEPLPSETQLSWSNHQMEMKTLELLRIPRCVTLPRCLTYQLHGFCDASEKAFAANVYLRCESEDGTIQVRLLAAKTKVAPLKPIQLPRLELCSAVLLVRLMSKIQLSFDFTIESIHAWCDSQIALCWIAAHPSRWKTYIANRVTEIQDTMSGSWHHVKSEDNPADCASRGISAPELLHHPLWWDGPPWLRSKTLFQSNFPLDEPEEVLQEQKRQPPLVVVVTPDLSMLSQFSSLIRLKRVTAYCFRFIQNAKMKIENRKSGPLTLDEINRALYYWVKLVQTCHFQPEITSLSLKEPLPKSSKLKCLNPFLDPQGVLRVGGRIRNAEVSFDQKFPCILPSKHQFTSLIINDEHRATLHGGAQLMWASIASRFWILNARDVIRQHIRRCIICFRHRKDTAIQMMADLPTARVTRARAFLKCGVDYAGPFTLRNCIGRSTKTYKGWVALFVCFSTRAIHLETVTSASTPAFLAALRRFTSRRGVCQSIHSDVGTNFVGANNDLKELFRLYNSSEHNHAVSDDLTTHGIQWIFNSPAAPHMGGLWEAGVKSFKHHLRRVVGGHTLSYEEFSTVLCQIEACLNSRPLCPMSTDPNDLSVLTPGHFLTGEALTTIPEPDLLHLPQNRLSRWQLVQQMVHAVWKRWNSEILTRLNQRPKWMSAQPNLVEGALVLIKEDNLPPLKWMLGRIVKVHPGKDGLVRIATVKTAKSELMRPIVKLCPLPIDSIIP